MGFTFRRSNRGAVNLDERPALVFTNYSASWELPSAMSALSGQRGRRPRFQRDQDEARDDYRDDGVMANKRRQAMISESSLTTPVCLAVVSEPVPRQTETPRRQSSTREVKLASETRSNVRLPGRFASSTLPVLHGQYCTGSAMLPVTHCQCSTAIRKNFNP